MKALVYTEPGQLVYQDFDDPVAGPDQQLIHIESVGICGSDMHGFLGHDPRRVPPLILGHEGCGTAADGTRYTINPLHPCGTCKYCKSGREHLCSTRGLLSIPPLHGAFAERIALGDDNLVEVPDGITATQASLTEPLACGWHAVKLALNACHDANPKTLVIGGGAIGLGAALCLAAKGVTDITIVEPNATRRAFLIDTCGQNAIEELDHEYAYEVVVDGVGYEATRAVASKAVEPGGVIAHIGLGGGEAGLDTRYFTLQEVTFIGTYCYTRQDFRDTAAALFEGRLGDLNWTEERPLSEGQRAFEDIKAGKVAAPKIVLVP